MKAVTITEPGDPDVLELREVDDPQPGPGEVLVKVAASAVNRADIMQRRGFYDPPPGTSPYPGLDGVPADVRYVPATPELKRKQVMQRK